MDDANIAILRRMQPQVLRLRDELDRLALRDYLLTDSTDYWAIHDLYSSADKSLSGLKNMANSLLTSIDACIRFGVMKYEGRSPSSPIDIVKEVTSLFGATSKRVQQHGWFCFLGIQAALKDFAPIAASVDFPSYFKPSREVYSASPYRVKQVGAARIITVTYYMPDVELGRRAVARYGGRKLTVRSYDASQAVIEIPDRLDAASGPIEMTVEIPTKDFWSFIRSASDDLTFKIAVGPDAPFEFSLDMYIRGGADGWSSKEEHGRQISYGSGIRFSQRKFPGRGGDTFTPSKRMGLGETWTVDLVEDWNYVEISSVFSDKPEIRRSKNTITKENPRHIGAGWIAEAVGTVLTVTVSAI
jgi:hypothetical protein